MRRSEESNSCFYRVSTLLSFPCYGLTYENMVVKARKSNAKDQSSEKDRSQSASGKSKRAKDGKGSASQSKNGLFAGFIRSKLGLSPSAFARGISVLVLGKALFLSR